MIRHHACSIDKVCDLTGTLSKTLYSVLALGPSFVCPDNRSSEAHFLENYDRWCLNPACNTECFCEKRFNPYSAMEVWAVKALGEAKRSTDVLKKADKGNCFVNMSCEQYEAMAELQLSKPAYTTLDPTAHARAMEDVAELIETISRTEGTFYNKHKGNFTAVAKRNKYLYFMPKIHKTFVDSPLGLIPPGRPITDAKYAEGSALDSLFHDLIKPIRAAIDTTVLGTLEAIIKIRNFQRTHGDAYKATFLTFDITDLYTNIPIKEALAFVKRELVKRKIVSKRLAHFLCLGLSSGRYMLRKPVICLFSTLPATTVLNLRREC